MLPILLVVAFLQETFIASVGLPDLVYLAMFVA